MKYIAILLLFSQVVLAVEPDNAYLKKGDSSPYEGILFPLSRAERIRLMDIDLTTANKRLDLSNQDNDLYQKRVENLTAENTRLSELNSKTNNFWSQFGLFILGAGTAVAMAYGLNHSIK